MPHAKIFAALLAILFTLPGLTGAEPMRVAAGLPPVGYLAKEIGKEYVTVVTALPEGRSPHDYAPGPQEIRDVARSRMLLSTGMPFEKLLARPLTAGKVKIVDVGSGIKRIPLEEGGHDHHAHEGHTHAHGEACGCSDDGLDPHLWLSLDNAIRMAENIRAAFAEADPANARSYETNARALTAEFEKLAKETAARLAPWRGRTFYVYHPAFGYFAHQNGLRQAAVELGGREAAPARLAELIRNARRDQVRVIFAQPQFNPVSARSLARAIDGKVVMLDPLAADLPKSIRAITQALEEGFAAEKKTE